MDCESPLNKYEESLFENEVVHELDYPEIDDSFIEEEKQEIQELIKKEVLL